MTSVRKLPLCKICLGEGAEWKRQNVHRRYAKRESPEITSRELALFFEFYRACAVGRYDMRSL